MSEALDDDLTSGDSTRRVGSRRAPSESRDDDLTVYRATATAWNPTARTDVYSDGYGLREAVATATARNNVRSGHVREDTVEIDNVEEVVIDCGDTQAMKSLLRDLAGNVSLREIATSADVVGATVPRGEEE